MSTPPLLTREEYIEQAYFFRAVRERMSTDVAVQQLLEHVHQEILATTRLPFAIQFLATEMRHSGLLSSGFGRLGHYFTAFQTFVIQQTEEERRRFTLETALLVLEREAQYRAGTPSPQGLFVYQFEAISRNRLGYDDGLKSMAADPMYDSQWGEYLDMVRRQIGVIDFADLVYVRSQLYVQDQRRQDPSYEPPLPPLFGDKEGKIAWANRGRDPLFLFAALQRQLGYPEVPRPRKPDDLATRLLETKAKVRELEMRLNVLEGEVRGTLDLNQFMNKPELLDRRDDD
ncbi:MAG TPA: hypothetical protein VFA18_11845 [Gemmataceae bacterium]|nr:hypothetical protein [Gemmataceae bacterium]